MTPHRFVCTGCGLTALSSDPPCAPVGVFDGTAPPWVRAIVDAAIAAERGRIVAAIRAGATSVAGPAASALHAVADALEGAP